MDIDAIISRGVATIHGLVGKAAVFSPLVGDDVALNVIVGTAEEFNPGGEIQFAALQVKVTWDRADIDRRVKRGETFTITGSGVVYSVVSTVGMTPNQGSAVVVVS